jgi:hypothetical protein
MYAAAFALVDDGFVFALQHRDDAPMCAPLLESVSLDGTVRWSTKLPIGDPWMPEAWESTSRLLQISGDAVLACFSEMPGTGIGFGYVVSLSDGALRFTTRRGPISEVAALDNGTFLVGYQGYGDFETLRYERDGRVHTRWASHGYYVIEGDEVRVIEMENRLPSTMHLVRLRTGGSVEKGAWLDGYYTSRPHLRADGAVLFFRAGALLAARGLSITDRLVLGPADGRSLSTPIVAGDWIAYFAFTPAGGEGRLVRVDW